MKQLFQKYREIIMYLIFGVLTTVIGKGTYLAIMEGAKLVLGEAMQNETHATYLAVYFAAQIIQWVAAVLFAFFTNRKWVFTDADRSEGTMGRQLMLFAGSRVASLGLDIAVTYGCILLLSRWIVTPPVVWVFELTPEFIAIFPSAVVVIIANYVLSKLFVFKSKKKDQA